MKPRVRKIFLAVMLALGLVALVSMVTAQTTSDGADNTTPPPLATSQVAPRPSNLAPPLPAQATPPAKKKVKIPRNPSDPSATPKIRRAKEIPFPLPIHNSAHLLNFPSYDQTGKLLSLLKAMKATRLDDEHVQMEKMDYDMNTPDGKDQYKIEMPTSVLNLRTNIITSDQPVIIRTKDFELTGEKVEFNTVESTGELKGRVHMVIHNFKSVVTPGQPAPAS